MEGLVNWKDIIITSAALLWTQTRKGLNGRI